MSSDVGIVKIEEVDREWDPRNKVWYEDVSTAELKLTNLQPPPEKRAMPWLPLLLDE